MQWQDEGIILSRSRIADQGFVLTVLTAENGRHGGFWQPRSIKEKAAIDRGTIVSVRWSARLAEHMGRLQVETLVQPAAHCLNDRARLGMMLSMLDILDTVLSDRQRLSTLYRLTHQLLMRIAQPQAPWHDYVAWELQLLAQLGYGLDLGACAVTQTTDQLIYISPKTGRAISLEAGREWAERLLTMPTCLRRAAGFEVAETSPTTAADWRLALQATGYFMHKCLLSPLSKNMPDSRQQLLKLLDQSVDGQPSVRAYGGS